MLDSFLITLSEIVGHYKRVGDDDFGQQFYVTNVSREYFELNNGDD